MMEYDGIWWNMMEYDGMLWNVMVYNTCMLLVCACLGFWGKYVYIYMCVCIYIYIHMQLGIIVYMSGYNHIS